MLSFFNCFYYLYLIRIHIFPQSDILPYEYHLIIFGMIMLFKWVEMTRVKPPDYLIRKGLPSVNCGRPQTVDKLELPRKC